MQQTTHYNLKKPEENDYADIAALSEDMDIIDTTMFGKIDATEKGQADGVATLGSDGKIPAGQIPATAYDPSGSAAAVQGNLNAHIADAVKHITAEERTAWNGKADAATSNIKTYTSLSQIGITAGQETIESVSEALSPGYMLVFAVGTSNNQAIYPFPLCSVTVIKTDASRVSWTAIQKDTGIQATGMFSIDTGFSGWVTNTEIVAGVYTGDDALSRTINLGFKPKAVLVLYEGRIIWNYDVYGGLVFEGYPTKSGEYVALEVASNGFIVHTNGNGCSTNDNDREYHYIAFK